MMYKLNFLLILFSLSSCISNSQYSKDEINDIKNVIITYKEIVRKQEKNINSKIDIIKKKDKEQPKKYSELKRRSDILQANITSLNIFIESLKKESNKKKENEFLLSSFFQKELFNGKDLSKKANILKNKIEKIYISNKELFSNYYELENYNELHFNTDKIIDENGNEIEYFNYKLFDKPVIDILEYL